MKIRTDFVTNSSSSSFILCFNEDHSFEDFKKYCCEYGYEEFLALVEAAMNSKDCVNKDDALDQVNHILNLYLERNWLKDLEEVKSRNPVERIVNADSIVFTEIWDYNGGLLEWAIRNGFLESEFSDYLAFILNIG